MRETFLEKLLRTIRGKSADAGRRYDELVADVAADRAVSAEEAADVLRESGRTPDDLAADVAVVNERRDKVARYARFAEIQSERNQVKAELAREEEAFSKTRLAFAVKCQALHVRRQQLEGEENALNEVRLWLLAHPPAAIVALRCRVLRRESSSGPPALRERYGADATWLREQLDPQERHGLAAAHARLLSKVRQMDKRKHLFTREAWEAECDRLQAIADEFDRVKLGPLRRKLEACQSLVMAIDRAAELIEAACCDPSAEALLKKTLVEIERKEAVYAAVRIELSEAMPAAGAGRSARASHPSDAEELLPLS